MDVRVSEILLNTIGEVPTQKPRLSHEDFSFTLKKLGEEGLQERLTGLIDKIGIQSDLIVQHMDISDLRKYRALITEFVNEVVTHSHEFTRENFLDRRGRHRVYGLVRVINKELDELAQELLKSETDNLTVLEKTGQIRGLLLDLVA